MSWSQKGLKQDLDTQSKLEGEINNSDLNKSFLANKKPLEEQISPNKTIKETSAD